MLSYPAINPTIVELGPIQIRWYGVMYILGFTVSYLLVRYQIRKKRLDIDNAVINDLFLYLIIGLIVGARIGYVIFYNLAFYFDHPLKLLAVWEGGMSFHGGLIGIVLSAIIFVRRRRIDFWQLADLVAVTAPIGLGLGRLGNFINAELYGRVTSVPWGMVFPAAGDLPRHPSQLYEFLLEGVLLFAILWRIKDVRLTKGALFCIFVILYGIFRFFVEFFRQPDPQIGFIFSCLTMGQVLSISMAMVGLVLVYARTRANKADRS